MTSSIGNPAILRPIESLRSVILRPHLSMGLPLSIFPAFRAWHNSIL